MSRINKTDCVKPVVQLLKKTCSRPARWYFMAFISHFGRAVTVLIQLQPFPRSPKTPIKPSDLISHRSPHKQKSENLTARVSDTQRLILNKKEALSYFCKYCRRVKGEDLQKSHVLFIVFVPPLTRMDDHCVYF